VAASEFSLSVQFETPLKFCRSFFWWETLMGDIRLAVVHVASLATALLGAVNVLTLQNTDAAENKSSAIIRTIAGTGDDSDNGNSGTTSSMHIGQPFGVEISPTGDLIVTEVRNHRIWQLNRTTGELCVIAGSGKSGYTGDGGSAIDATMNEPYEVRYDSSGNLFVVEMKNHVVRRIDAKSGIITTVAGTGSPGNSGDGGPAVNASLKLPHGIVIDEHDVLYIADIGNHRIRRVSIATGVIDTLVGNGKTELPKDGSRISDLSLPGPRAMAIDGDSLWVVLREGNSLWRIDLKAGTIHHVAGIGVAGYSGDGGPALKAAFHGPKGIAADRSGNLFIVDSENDCVRRYDRGTGVLTTVAGRGRSGSYSGDGGPATQATFSQPHGICVDSTGMVYVADTLNHRVRGFSAEK
jgi:sugar lactone lactonase YvrE